MSSKSQVVYNLIAFHLISTAAVKSRGAKRRRVAPKSVRWGFLGGIPLNPGDWKGASEEAPSLGVQGTRSPHINHALDSGGHMDPPLRKRGRMPYAPTVPCSPLPFLSHPPIIPLHTFHPLGSGIGGDVPMVHSAWRKAEAIVTSDTRPCFANVGSFSFITPFSRFPNSHPPLITHYPSTSGFFVEGKYGNRKNPMRQQSGSQISRSEPHPCSQAGLFWSNKRRIFYESKRDR